MTRAAVEAAAAADKVLDWLVTQRGRTLTDRPASEAAGAAVNAMAPADAAVDRSVQHDNADAPGRADFGDLPPDAGLAVGAGGAASASSATKHQVGETYTDGASVMWLPSPDWLYHRVTITGAPDTVARFRLSAAGVGAIPWQLDLDAAEEDWFHRLVAPPAPLQRSLSVTGARIFARDLREAVGQRHEVARTRVGRSRACPFDLHALVPVPEAILCLGPDDRTALTWLWEHWGTTDALRQVVEAPVKPRDLPVNDDALPMTAFRVTFWSRDWTPWRAFARLGSLWSALRFDVQPLYEDA